MRKELVFKINHSNYTEDKYYFQKDKKKPISINEVDTRKIVLSNKTSHGEEGVNRYYIRYDGSTGVRPLHIVIKNLKLYTNHVNVLADDNELLKYVEIWNKIKTLLNQRLYNIPVYNQYIRTKISLYSENFHGNKRLTKDKYYGHSILLIESICKAENKYYPQTFLDEFFECNSVEAYN